jgi:hypothetical protein
LVLRRCGRTVRPAKHPRGDGPEIVGRVGGKRRMDVFDLDRSIVADYEHFARSFTQIRADDIHQQIDVIYAGLRFWPEPLISINPHF